MGESLRDGLKDFSITLLKSHMRGLDEIKQFFKPGLEDCLCFCFESEPNLAEGDRFKIS